MKKIVLATANTHKVIEFQRILGELLPDLELIASSSFSKVPVIEETGATFAENALLKAKVINNFTNLPVIADDSGLVVEALNGAPGIFSARYAGKNATDQENVAKLISEIKNVDDSLLEASFECAIALVDQEQNLELVVQGLMPGRVVKQARGANGFGYDPMFIPQGFSKTSAELSDQEKDKISHRGIALRKMSGILKQLQG